MDDSFKRKASLYFIYYYLTPLPLVISMLGQIFLALTGSENSGVGVGVVFITLCLLWFFLLCVNFFVCNADGNPFELYVLSIIPALIYSYLYSVCYRKEISFEGGDANVALRNYRLVIAVWLIYGKSIIFLEDRRWPLT
jgi:hypothetical protein